MASPNPPLDRGTLAVLAAALLWGTIGVLSVALFSRGVSPWEVAFWRAALATAALLGYLLGWRRDALKLKSASDLALLAGFGAVGVGLFFSSFQLATQLTSVAVAVVLLYTAPVMVMVGAHFLLGERLTAGSAAVAALVVAGVWCTALGASGAQVRITAAGVAWGLAAALSYSAYYLFGRRYLPRFGVARTLFFSLLFGTIALGPSAALAGHPPRLTLSWAAWALLLALALGATLLAHSLYYWGLRRVEAGRAAVLASIEPAWASLLALVLFGQRLTPVGWFGVALVVGGVAAAARLSRRPPPPAPMSTDHAP